MDELRVTIEPFDTGPTEAPHAKQVGGTSSSICLIGFFITILLLDATCIKRDMSLLYNNVFNKWPKKKRQQPAMPEARPMEEKPPNPFDPRGPPIVDDVPWPWAQAFTTST